MEIYAKNIDGVWFGIASEEHRVLATTFGSDENDVIQSLKETLNLTGPLKTSAPSASEEKAFSTMKRFREGKGTLDNVSLCMDRLPTYTQRVLRTVSQIPVGYVSSYGGVAEAAGGGARAVGNAMAKNPFAPIVPCHRVVTSSLGLGGYTGGLRVKYDLLKREKRGYTEPKSIQVESGMLKVFPVEFVLGKLEKLFAKRAL
jgi:methylated-DNA-[protein]-cysteine S-methyltransferase